MKNSDLMKKSLIPDRCSLLICGGGRREGERNDEVEQLKEAKEEEKNRGGHVWLYSILV